MYVCVFVFNCPALIVCNVSQSRTPPSGLTTTYVINVILLTHSTLSYFGYFWDISINACQLKHTHWLIYGEKVTRYLVKSWKMIVWIQKILKNCMLAHQRWNIPNLQKPGIGQKPIYRLVAGNELKSINVKCNIM